MAKKKKLPLWLVITLIVIFVVLLWLTPIENPLQIVSASEGQDLEALAIPAHSSGDEIVSHTGYTLSYSEENEQAFWVAYVLTSPEVFASDAERDDNFRPDGDIRTQSASLADYKGSGYDRGHLIPAADLKWSLQAMDDSFFLSNMSPQEGSFNRGIWASLEATVRTFAAQKGAICVVTGPILTDGPYKTIGENEVSVPYYYYKVILAGDQAIGFILPNEGSNKSLESFAVTVNEVEEFSGLDFFCLLEDEEEEKVESSFDLGSWDFTEFNIKNTKYEETDEIVSTVVYQEPDSFAMKFQFFLFENLSEFKKQILSEISALF